LVIKNMLAKNRSTPEKAIWEVWDAGVTVIPQVFGRLFLLDVGYHPLSSSPYAARWVPMRKDQNIVIAEARNL
jgi:hypothetical protein